MKTTNTLDKPFGPAGASAGLVLCVVGLLTAYNSLFGFILVIIGAFAGLTSTSTIVDFDRKRVKFTNNLFGIIRLGKWVPIEPNMKIGIKKSNQVWRNSSLSNRTLAIKNIDYRIILYDFDEKQVMQIKKVRTQGAAKTELAKLAQKFGLRQI
ncbi:MAG: hypothetical protein WC384_18975 [Prolixibacteraceae bacterium]|jgi:hypothetical protein